LSIYGFLSDTTLSKSKDLTFDRVNNIANFKIPLIDGADTVSTVLNNSKIRFRKLLVILITFGMKKYMLLRIYVVLSMSVTLKSASRSIPDIPQVVSDF
jgi:hypothetical protein